MRWKGGRQSDNVEDRRGQDPGMGAAGLAPAALRLLPMLVRTKFGRVILIGGIVLIFGGRMLGIDVLSFLGGAGGAAVSSQTQMSPAEIETAEFVSVVLASTEDTWNVIFRQLGLQYREPTLVLFNNRVSSACGMASSAVGPFYCPADQKLYIDLAFFSDLALRHGAPGDFAQAYVVAHEVGHHVQTLLGTSRKVSEARQGRSEAEINALSVRQELQADCYAGLWGNMANRQRRWLEPGDLEEALDAAAAIGDDRLQKEAGHQAVPDSFTHGTSAQRERWFREGFEGGDINACDTFSSSSI